MPNVTLVGVVGNARATTAAITGTFGQTPTQNNLLVAIVTGTGTTTAVPTVTCSTGGWRRLTPVGDIGPQGNNDAATGFALVDVWGAVAVGGGGDTAPAFTVGVAGTITTSVSIFELNNANNISPLNVGYSTYASGATAATVAMSAASWPSMTAGDFAISAFVQERASATVTWNETGTGWTSAYSDGATTSTGHRQVNYQATPSATAAVVDSGNFSTDTTAYGAGITFTIVPPGINEDPSELDTYYYDYGVTPVAFSYGVFSPPAGSTAVALVAMGYSSNTGPPAPVVTVSDSGGHTWVAGPSVFSGVADWAGIYTCYFPAAPGSITVSVANSDASHGAAGAIIDVRVLTGAAAVQAGAGHATAFSASNVTAITGAITTTTPASLVFMVSTLDTGITAWTDTASTVQLSGAEDTTDGATYFTGRASNRTTTPGSLTLGYTSPTASPYAWAALEILPAGRAPIREVNQAVMRAAVW